MIIGISGKIGAGKNTVASIIQWLTESKEFRKSWNNDITGFLDVITDDTFSWKQKAFATKLKQVASILTGVDIKNFESQDFKNQELGEEWIRYGYADGFVKDQDNNPTMIVKQCDKETYEEQCKINWQTAYKEVLTYRSLLQRIGTEAMRDNINQNVWVNALFVDYKGTQFTNIRKDAPEEVHKRNDNLEITEEDELIYGFVDTKYPNWIITDMRFPNEYDAVKKRGGITLRINRPTIYSTPIGDSEFNNQELKYFNHISETALDNHQFDYVINNDGTIEDLIKKVNEFLNQFKIIK